MQRTSRGEKGFLKLKLGKQKLKSPWKSWKTRFEEISPERVKPQNDKREGIKYMKIRGMLSPRHNTTKFQGADNILKDWGQLEKNLRSNIRIWSGR